MYPAGKILALSLSSILAASVCAQPAANYTLAQVSGNLYRGSVGNWHSAVYVTGEGIVLVDTLNRPYATWLKEELARRFPDVPVKYVIYTHSHWDHVEGGSVFEDTATFIAQEGMGRNMDGRYPHMPGDMVDRNGNGMFEPEEFRIPWDEAPGVCGASYLTRLDADSDGHLTPQEYFRDIRSPDVLFQNEMAIHLGGKDIRVMYVGRNHADDMSVVLFEDERALFSADFLADALTRDTMHSLPSACGPFDGHPLQEWIDGYALVEALDFDILSTAHGNPLRFTKQDVTDTRVYFETLLGEVREGMEAGWSLEEMKANIRLEQYSGWDQYERLREKNIEAAYANLRMSAGQ